MCITACDQSKGSGVEGTKGWDDGGMGMWECGSQAGDDDDDQADGRGVKGAENRDVKAMGCSVTPGCSTNALNGIFFFIHTKNIVSRWWEDQNGNITQSQLVHLDACAV